MPPSSQQTTEDMVRAMLLTLRDKALADARQNMKMVRDIERRLGLTPASTKGKE